MNGKPPMNNSGASSVDLFITHLDHVGPYLKIFGQANKDAAFLVSKRIETLLPTCFAIDPSWSNERQQALLTPGTFCVFKRTKGAAPGDVEYMRTRVLSAGIDDKHLTANNRSQMRVEIEFLDYGYKRNVSSHDLLFSKQPQLLQNVPVLCSQYIVLGICSEWDKSELDAVNQLIGNHVVSIEVDPTQICGQKFASVRWKDFELNEYLVQQKQIGAPITNDLIMDHCKKLWKVAPQSPVIEYNNNVQSTGNSAKTPTDVAREQLAARFSLAARLDVHRSLNTTPPRPLKSAVVNEFIPTKQQQAQTQPLQVQPPQLMPTPLANLTNVLPATVQTTGFLANAQKPAFAAGHAFNQPSANYPKSEASSGLMLPTHNVFTPKTNPRPLNMYYNVRLNNPMQPPLVQMPKQPSLSYAPARYALSQPPQAQQQQQQQKPQAVQPLIPAFRTTSLTVGLTYDVYVSFVENGPHLFWVQLKSATNDLNAMMGQIEKLRLQKLSLYPGVGTACVARFSEDGNCYRALVSAVYGQRYRVVYVDYGNSEMVNLTDLYQIPQELLQVKPFAFRFALAGAKELGALDESMKRIFKNAALYVNFQLTVQAPESVGSMQTCQLLHNGASMLDVLKKLKNSRQAYAKADQLTNDDNVEIRFIDSPSNFYVQKVDNIKQFEQLMDEMFSYYNTNQMVPDQLVLGAPCVVKCDREWYRAELLRVDDHTIIVRHVDFGYEQHVKRHLIGIIAEKHLTMPRQAIKCCLKGFENSELSQDKITDQFEMLAEESNIRRRTFSVRVFRIEPDGLNVVNLLAKNLNVMKKLYKLSMPFEQYLSLEKGQFNSSVTRADSMSSDVIPQQLEKGEVLNSTTVESEDRMQMQKQTRAKNTNANINANDWDKHSSASASSKDTQSQQSNSKRSQHQSPRNQQENKLVRRSRDTNLESFESRSTSSYASGMSSPRKGNRVNGRNRNESPRLQNGKLEANKNTRFSDSQSPRKDSQQSQRKATDQRSQNAPQGFAQKPQRQKSTLDGTVASSKRSSGVESDVGSSVETNSTKSKPEAEPEKYVPLDKPFAVQDIKTPSKDAASLSWFVSPFQFYIVPKSLSSKYDNLLREMRQFYRQKPHQPLQLKVNSSVVVRQRKDNAIMRGTVVACNHMRRNYRIFCVDTGYLITVTSEDVWQVEQRFMGPPCLAQRCSFDKIITNYDHLYIVDQMEKFVPANAKVECEFNSKANDTYIVKVLVNNASLRDTLINAQFITEVAEPVRVGLLAGQQVRGKFTSIRDMTNFKIQLESCRDVNFLCSYDDAKFVKSNKNLAKPFKEHYEGKSYALNIKHVCENNIIHLRPVMPLLMEDRSGFICAYPILVNNFKALVVYTAKSYRISVQPSAEETAMKQLLDEMYEYYNKKGKQLRKFEKDQICAALSTDGNWYRARILANDPKSKSLDVFYLDYGNSEQLPRDQLKQLEEKFYANRSCYAVEINLPFGRIHNDEKLKSRLAKLLDEQLVIVKPIETRRSHLIADVMLVNGKESIVDTLKAEKLVAGRDIEYMRKQLDKEKPHIYEHIEYVDLTTDDDESLQQRKQGSKSSSVNSSPKSKKEPKEPKEQKQRQKPQPEQVAPTAPVVEKTVAPVVKAEPKEIIKEKEVAAPVTAVIEPPEEPAQSAPEPTPVAVVEDEPIAEPTPAPVAVTPVPDPYKDMETAVLSHCDNPAHFYVHPMDALPKLKRLTENLQIISPSMPQLVEIVNGADCISMYSMDKSWYRAKIIDAELMVLQFIDFGNTDCVSDAKEIKQSLCSQTEPFCLPFALPIAPNGKLDWADAANGIFNDSYEKILHYEYLTRGDYQTSSYVNLYIEGVDVTKKLIADGYAKPLDYVTSGSTCYISHVNSISDFYIQLESDSKALELIEMYLGDAVEKLQPLQRFEKGSIVAALFDDDDLFYRAELLRQLPDSRYEVRFIDYGNTSTSAKCLLLSEEIASVPSLSKRCSLQLPKDYVGWSKEAEAKFTELTGEGELVFTTQLLQPGLENVVIHLMLDEDNVLDQLLPLCTQKQPEKQPEPVVEEKAEAEVSSSTVNAIVTHVDSPLSFYLQLEVNNALVDSTIEQLNGENAKLQPIQGVAQLGELFVAQFADDNEFYRARILEQLPAKESLQYRVLFIDYGNQALVDKLFELPGELAQLKALADLHALESSPNFIKFPKESREALDALVDSCNGEVAVEFVNKSAQPPIVKLRTLDNALNIHEQLQKLLEVENKNAGNECIISHGDSPKSFYIQLKKRSAELDLIVKTLQNSKREPLTRPAEKLNGICYSQEDDCYYRCCINSVLSENKGYEVFLVDYGNTIVTQQIYHMPEEVLQIPPLAFHCQLKETPKNITNDAFSVLLEQHFGEVYEIVGELNENQSTLQSVQLRINYKDFAQELANVSAGIQKPLVVELHNCIVVQFDNAKSFYVQMEQDVKALEEMTDKMLDAEQNFDIFTDLKVGAICVAKFPEDEVFYRAEIVKLLDDNKCEVHFIDFGNNAVTNEFRQLPEDLAKAPRYSKHCELESATIAKCDVAALGAFIDTRFSETFQLEILAKKDENEKETETHVVRLFYQNTNISDKLRLQEKP